MFPMEENQLWHVTVTVAGAARPQMEVRAAMDRLLIEHPFLLTCRYDSESAELSYWDQGCELEDPAAIGLRLWSEHRLSAKLPPWHVVGLEVIDRATYRRRSLERESVPLREPGCTVSLF